MEMTKLMLTLLAGAAMCSGCFKKSPEQILKEAAALEASGKYEEALAAYAGLAASGKQPEAFGRIGDLYLSRGYLTAILPIPEDTAGDCEAKVGKLEGILAKAEDSYDRAKTAGCEASRLEAGYAKIKTLKESIDALKAKDVVLRQKEAELLEQARKEQEAERKAELVRQEQARKEAEAAKQAELARQEQARKEEAARQEQARKEAEERQRRQTPEYCIENDLELSEAAFKHVVEEVTYRQSTGNSVYDEQENKRHQEIYAHKTIKISGKITEVEEKFWGTGIKVYLSVAGKSVLAIFRSMSKGDAAGLRVGETLRVTGQISDGTFTLADITLDNCGTW